MTDTKKGGILSHAAEAAACIVLIIIDLLTKSAAENLKGQAGIPLIDGVFELYYLENRGAAFGMLQNAKWFFLLIAGAAIILIAVLLVKMPRKKKYLPLRVLMVFLAAGAAGNLVDRAVLGYVRDFLYFRLIDFPVFNVADIYVTCSIAVFIVLILFYYKDEELSDAVKIF